jgi:hypothetical protein
METLNLADIDNAVGQAFGRKPKAAPQPSQSNQPSQVSLEGLNPALLANLQKAQAAYKQEFGTDMPITSGVRTRAEQQKLFDQSKAGKPGVFSPIDPASAPGQSTFHSEAVDISSKVPEDFLNRFGIHRPLGKKDPVHAVLMPGQVTGAEMPQGFADFNPQNINAAVQTALNEKVEEKPRGVVGKVGQFLRGQGRGVASAADVGINAITGTMDVLAYPLARAYYGTQMSPEAAEAKAKAETTSPKDVVGRAFGVTETPQYKGEASRQVMDYIGANLEKGVDAIQQGLQSQGINIPKGDVENMVNQATFLIPGGAKAIAKTKPVQAVTGAVRREAGYAGQAIKAVTPEPVQRVVGGVVEAIAPGTTNVKPKAAPAAVPGTPEAPGVELKRNVDELDQRYQAERQAATQPPAAAAVSPEAPPVTNPLTGETVLPTDPRYADVVKTRGSSAPQAAIDAVNAAEAQKPAPAAPAASPLGTSKPTTPDAPFSEVKYAENGLPLDEQYSRAKTLNRVLGSDHAADLAAIEGKGKERATNYATSNTDTATGNFLKERFADEQKRLADFAERQVKNTGGTVGLDESSVYKRGNTILKPLQDLETNFDTATRKIYAERDALAKDIPVEAQNIMKVLNDESLTLANTETIGLTNIAKARMKQLGMIDKDGNLLPTDAKTAENFRKFVNENWDRKNANLHRQLKEAVDTDVLANLDTNTPFYKEARALVELRKNTLDNPNGISKILDAEGPKGINRKVQIEKIAQNIADMPVDQFTHVIDTLKGVPPELQPQATAALSEIKAQFANRVAEQKTPRQVTKYMNDNREVMNRVFTPDEMSNLRDYHNAVHILATDTGYKGAAVQKINVEQKLGSKIAEQVMSKGAALTAGGIAEVGTGGVTIGTAGGAAALAANELMSQRFAGKRAKAQAQAEQQAFENTQKRFVPIQDLVKK